MDELNINLLRGKICCIEGPIGVGKTSLCKSIESALSGLIPIKFYTEPFNQTMLEQFLQDPPRYAYAFQLYMLTRRQTIFTRAIFEAKMGYFCIIDRSLIGDYVFATLQKNLNNITNQDFDVYVQEYNKFTEYQPDSMIYLSAPIETQLNRIEIRHRNCEDKYDIDYIKQLNDVYLKTLQEHFDAPNKKVHIIDWSTHVPIQNDILESNTTTKVIKTILDTFI